MSAILSRFLVAFAVLTGAALSAAADQTPETQTLRVAVTAFPPGAADVRRSVSIFATYTWSPVFEALTTFAEDGTLKPELATSWRQISPTRWEFTLRDGVMFSNGRALTAHDIVENIKLLTEADGPQQPVGILLDYVAGAVALDDRTVQVETRTPNAVLPREISALYIVDPATWRKIGVEAFARAPIGTGPFKVARWGIEKIDYVPHAFSWRAPKVKALEIRNIPESTARLQALLAGQTDVAIGLGVDEKPMLENAGGRLHMRRPIDVMSIALVTGDRGPTDDVRVRRALNYAVDKDAIANVILQGTSRPATQGAVEGLLGYDPTLKAYPYDPTKARVLLKEAGYEKGFALNTEVVIGANPGDGAIYQVVADNLAAVNVKMNLIPIPTSQMVRVVNGGEWKGNSFSQIFGAWPAFDPLRTIRLHSCLWPKPWFCDKGISETLKAAQAAPTLDERARLTTDILRFYHDQATTLLLHEVPMTDGVAQRVKNYAPQKAKINYETIELAD
jgi:peptide/nickel transport system substrate-binding protein